MRRLLILIIGCTITLSGCRNTGNSEIIIFHAGSLSVPFKQMADEYEKRNPGIRVLLEPAGSLVCARKITELKKPCDIIASADYFVIDELIVPEYSAWSIRFATNEMVLAFSEKSLESGQLTSDNWYEVLSSDDVIYARADPDADPGGYRTLFTFKLAEKYYGINGLADKLSGKNENFIRPKEVDLVALLESNAVDYIFIYRSVAIQHGFKYLELPPEINLADPGYNDTYRTVSLEVTSGSAGSKMKVTGEYINYSLSVLDSAVNKSGAIGFVAFLLSDEGMDFFRKNGQSPIIPFTTEQPELVPEQLLQFLKSHQLDN